MEGQQPPHLNENLYCCVCCNLYSDSRRPASLRTCDDHIFCEPCLLNWANEPSPTCPFCRIPYTREDIKVERRFFEMVQVHLNSLRLFNLEALRTQVKQRFKDLEPSLASLIVLKKAIISYYNKAIKNTNHSMWANGTSMALKSLAAGFCFFPVTAPVALLAMGVTSVADLGQNLYFIHKKKGIYCEIGAAIRKHDQILHDKRVKQCFDLYHELQTIRYIQHLMTGEKEVKHHLNQDSLKLVSSGIHATTTLAKGMGWIDTGFATGKGSGECVKLQRSLEVLGKGIVIAAIVAELGLFLYDMKKGLGEKGDLVKTIKETKEVLRIYEIFLQRSKRDELC